MCGNARQGRETNFDVNVNVDKWWDSVPANVSKIVHEHWNKMTDAEKVPYVTLVEKIILDSKIKKWKQNCY